MTLQEAFEHWFCKEYSLPYPLKRGRDGLYDNQYARISLKAWEAQSNVSNDGISNAD